jgi:hypothetical protein
MNQTTIRSNDIPAWRASWRASFPDHGLSLNLWLSRAIEEWIEVNALDVLANLPPNAKSNITGVKKP